MNREYHRWHSGALDRDMECLLFGHGGEPVLLFPTSRGRFFQNEDFGLIGSLADRIDQGRYVVLCVDSIDGETWFGNGAGHDRMARHEQYERYIVEEAVPFVRGKSSGGRLTVGGCSMGGFHAVNMGLRKPEVFARVLSMGGQFDTAQFLGGYHDESVFYHSVFEWLPNAPDWHLAQLRAQEIILAVGEHDFCRGSNEGLGRMLEDRGVPAHVSIWHGETHDWPAWRKMAPEYLGF